MQKQDYKKLNTYLNDIFNILKDDNNFLIKNILFIAKMNDAYLDLISNYEISNYTKENKLTYEEIYLLAREIIASINLKYLEDYDNLIESGQLDFGYNNEYNDSYFIHEHNLINIRREFNYNDVISLVHEFIHYTNGKEKQSKNRYLLTEFLSIYFEMYALDYLIAKDISKEEIGLYDRLISTLVNAKKIYTYEIVFLAYEKFGNIDEDTINYLNEYYLSISKDDFLEECMNLLNCFIEKDKTNNNSENIYEIVIPFFNHYRYLIGTLIAFYAKDYCKLEDIVNLNNHINDDIGNMDTIQVLRKIGINVSSEEFLNKALESIEVYIKKYSNQKK